MPRWSPRVLAGLGVFVALLAAGALLAGWPPGAGSRARHDATPGAEPAPLRVVSLCSAATEAMVALGIADRLAGVDEHSAPAGAPHVPVLAAGGRLSAERLLAAKPQVAFAWWYQQGAIEQMQSLGLRVVPLRAQNVAEAVVLVERVAEACSVAERGAALAGRLRSELAELEREPLPATQQRPLVYLELHSPFKSCGPGSYAHDLIVAAGGRDVAADAGTAYPMVSSEVLLARQPDVILLVRAAGTPKEDLTARPGWAGLRAVAGGRVHVLPNDLMSPGPRVAEAVRTLRRLLHPEPHAGDTSCRSTR
jgi:iron complex transport system substrate-binding protein